MDKNRIIKLLERNYVMQVATTNDGKPWICTVYYVVDSNLNLYWASIPSRRHSKDIANCEDTAIAVSLKYKIGSKVMGFQSEGTACMLEDKDKILPVAKKYARKFKMSKNWFDNFCSFETEHRLYMFTPKKAVLFDDENHPKNPRQEINLA